MDALALKEKDMGGIAMGTGNRCGYRVSFYYFIGEILLNCKSNKVIKK